MTIRHETRAAIAALPGKTLRPWKDGDARCHCTHCALCGELYRTEDIAKHEDECQAALLEALETRVVDFGELTPKGGDAFLGGMLGAFAGGMMERKLREFGQRPKCKATRGGRACSLPLGHDTPHLWGAKTPADAKAKARKGSSRS